MIRVNLHGKLGQDLGEYWELDVSSVSEALRAIDVNTKQLRKWLIDYKDEYEYEILVDNNNLFVENADFKTIQDIKNSEFFLDIKDKIQTIDIVPSIIGSGAIGKIFLGAVAVIGAIAAVAFTGGLASPFVLPAVALGIAGLGLIAAGTSELLSKPPPNVPFTAQQTNPIEGQGEAGGATSYLFNGPVNTVGEGGAVPVGYGQLVVGGNNVFSSYDILYRGYTSDFNNDTLQVVNQGSSQYLFNSRCFLVDQNPLSTIPF
jgi:predicted phage tail protein